MISTERAVICGGSGTGSRMRWKLNGDRSSLPKARCIHRRVYRYVYRYLLCLSPCLLRHIHRSVYRTVSIALYPSLSLDCLGPCLTSVLLTVPTLGRQYQAKECKHGLLLFRICAPAAYNCPTGNGTTSKPQVPQRSVGQV